MSCSLGGPKPCFEVSSETLRQMDKILAGEDVLLSNCTDGAIAYRWDFGDGQTSVGNSPHHTWERPGEYTITLEAESEKSIKSTSQDIVVEQSLYGTWVGHIQNGTDQIPISFKLSQKADKIKGEFIYGNGQNDGVVSSNSTIENDAILMKCSYVTVRNFRGEVRTFTMLFTFEGTINESMTTMSGDKVIVDDEVMGSWILNRQ
jgi:PKD repeat protein